MKMARRFSAAVISTAILSVGMIQQASFAQGSPITDAYRQLRLLSSGSEAGMSYVSFMQEWRQVNGLISIAIEDSKPSNLTKQLETIKMAYGDVARLWGCSIESSKFLSVYLSCLGNDFQSRYPQITSKVSSISDTDVYFASKNGIYNYRGMFGRSWVPLLLSEAGLKVKQLGQMLSSK